MDVSFSPTRRFFIWTVAVVGVWMALGTLLWLGWGVDQRTVLPSLLWLSLAVVLLLSGIAYLLFSTPPGAIRLWRWCSIAIILAVAIAVRVAALKGWAPTLSDDIFRYRQEGRLVLNGVYPGDYLPAEEGVRVHPYTGQPIALAEHPTDLLDRMSNNGFLPTMYFPLSHAAYGFEAWLQRHFFGEAKVGTGFPAGGAKGERLMALTGSPALLAYRWVHVIADVVVVALLMLALMGQGRSVWWAVLYAWHPLPVIEIGGNGHFEPVGLIFVLLGLLLAQRRWWVWASVAFGVAFLAKPIALFALPALAIVAWRAPEGKARWLRVSQIGLAWGLTVTLGFLSMAGHLGDLRTTLGVISVHYYHNGFFFELLRWFGHWIVAGTYLEDLGAIRYVLGGLSALATAGVLGLAWRYRWPVAKTLGHACVIYLLFSVLLYPWYGLWPLVLVPLAWNRASWVLAYTLLLSYTVHARFAATGEWEVPFWAMAVAWVPVVVLEVQQLFLDCRAGAEKVQPLPEPVMMAAIHGA